MKIVYFSLAGLPDFKEHGDFSILKEKSPCFMFVQEEDSAEVNEMVRTAKVTPEQLAALLRQSATTTPNPAALSAVGAAFEKEVADED